MDISWNQDERASYATARSEGGLVQYHLITEQVPDVDYWDWAVWQKGLPVDAGRHGKAPSALNARIEATIALERWQRGMLSTG